MSGATWKEQLAGKMSEQLATEIDTFELQIELKRQGKIDEKLFAETRLRRGVYGQRYDNGLRDDGTGQKALVFPSGELTKGPETLFDAPGMVRIKIPFGKLTADQLDVLSDLAEEYSDQILHVTTRQDIQLHFVHIEDTPDLMRRLASVGITTREACGNAVRNVTACEFSGVCNDESFDATPYALAMTDFMMGHPDAQDFGRKFKIAFSGCEDHPCGLVAFHDLGAVALKKEVDGELVRGFKVVVGGGLGAVPVQAKVLHEFLPEAELLPVMQAIARVFGRLGEKQSRAKARVKFLVNDLGLEEFARLVAEERATLRTDERWTKHLDDLHITDEEPIREAAALPAAAEAPGAFARWAKTNLRPQARRGYYTATVKMPLGDFTPTQGRALADLARQYTGDAMRCTVEQNIVFRWLSGADCEAFHAALGAIGLDEAGAGGITDITSCPGTDTCKLGISSSRGVTGALRKHLTVLEDRLDPAVAGLRIKASGCFNSCGQHHVADLGFLGVTRNVGGRRVPHFNVVLGGQWTHNGGAYGLVVGAVPSKNIPEAVDLITAKFAAERSEGETFQAFMKRVGKAELRKLLAPISKAPTYEEDPSYYSDWGDPREYTIGDLGIGECAGELVPFVEFGLQGAEQELYEAQDQLDAGVSTEAAEKAYTAMVSAAKALVRYTGAQVRDDADDVVASFREHLHDTKLFHDRFAKGKFANYLLTQHAEAPWRQASEEDAHRVLDEARLFLEASHSCYARLVATAATAAE